MSHSITTTSLRGAVAKLLILLFVVTTTGLHGQTTGNFPPPDDPPTITAHRANGKIVLDGNLSEADWQTTRGTSDFFRVEPRQGGRLRYTTSVKVLYDERNLYVGIFARDSLGKKGIRVQDMRRDFSWGENDIVGIQLDPQNLKQYCVSFQTTPYGSQRDLQNFNDTNTDNDWNALWNVRTMRTDTGYYAEFAIPFRSLRYDETKGDVSWGITLLRLARRDYEQAVFPAIPQSFSPYRMTYAAKLVGLELPKPGTNLRVEPYALYQYDRVKEGSRSATEQQPKLGGDVKWAITPNSVLDVTFNTDFAQAEVDRAVNNLERFNIFFPERRQFFLENSGIWAGANSRLVVPFFSRRIGLEGNFNAAPARINVGSRFTSRTEKRAIAGLLINQAETDNSPAANFAIARYLRNYGRENNIGGMITHRLDEASNELGTRQQHNTTLTIDGLIRPRNELTVNYMLSGSRDGETEDIGVAGQVFAGYQKNDLYLGWESTFVSPDYQPDIGFVFQKDVIRHNPGGYYIWRPKNIPWIRRFDPGVFADYYHDASDPGNFQQANITIFPIFLIFTNGSFFEYNIVPTWQNINFDFAPLGVTIPEANYYYTRQRVRFNTDRSAKLSGSSSYDWGKFYNGRRTTFRGGLRYAPSVYAAISADYERNNLSDLGTDTEDLTTQLYTVGARFALNPRLQLSSFYQYNSFDERGRWNFRLSWEYQPLSFLYLVFNETQLNNLDTPFQEQQVVSKLTFTRQL